MSMYILFTCVCNASLIMHVIYGALFKISVLLQTQRVLHFSASFGLVWLLRT